uniref:Thioredoxin domain-containing protein n=1 Tax=Stomoxys calcitrans TaxID=35570 RepID=A0A1I8PPC3_STOCA
MLKIFSNGLKSCLRTVTEIGSKSHTQKSATRLFSRGQNNFYQFSIKDLKEFDQKVLNNDHPVIVDFHAIWCEPCHILTPQLKSMFGNSQQIGLAIVDVDSNADLVEVFNVKAVPAVLAFNNGKIVDKFIGLADEKRLESMTDLLKSSIQLPIEGEEDAAKTKVLFA